MADVAELHKPLYADSGIFYEAEDANINHGFACVFGPQGTPYEDCPMLYEFNVGPTFPFDPPKVEFRTYDGITRFHPNMYKEGKCCLSILHTWEGPKWASTMRLSTILVTLQSLMDTNPLAHEPGFAGKTSATHTAYAEFVEFSCMRYIVERQESLLKGKQQPTAFQPFVEEFQSRIPAILQRLKKRLETHVESGEKVWPSITYNLSGKSEYAGLLARVNALL
jgi:ubiquitin-protein ligase